MNNKKKSPYQTITQIQSQISHALQSNIRTYGKKMDLVLDAAWHRSRRRQNSSQGYSSRGSLSCTPAPLSRRRRTSEELREWKRLTRRRSDSHSRSRSRSRSPNRRWKYRHSSPPNRNRREKEVPIQARRHQNKMPESLTYRSKNISKRWGSPIRPPPYMNTNVSQISESKPKPEVKAEYRNYFSIPREATGRKNSNLLVLGQKFGVTTLSGQEINGRGRERGGKRTFPPFVIMMAMGTDWVRVAEKPASESTMKGLRVPKWDGGVKVADSVSRRGMYVSALLRICDYVHIPNFIKQTPTPDLSKQPLIHTPPLKNTPQQSSLSAHRTSTPQAQHPPSHPPHSPTISSPKPIP